jgi:predicted TIM-barrel fold metal-dependent hydrolase
VFPEKWRPLISLPGLHPTNATHQAIASVEALADRFVTSLDEFLQAVFCVMQRCVERGVVGIKDQSAYSRVLAYGLPPRADAERLFNRLLADPRNSLGWPEGKALNDYLFHQYMRFARDLDLPVQIHTGHMAGIRNRVEKTNAAHFASVLELHREVSFDLFHGNWPYMGDYLFLGKNYPNVALDCCWLHIIDPDYASELLERAVLTLPHTKVHGFGGDYGDTPEFVAGHLQIARENVAGTLARLVERGWLDEGEALELAAAWLYNNPNDFFRLGLTPI